MRTTAAVASIVILGLALLTSPLAHAHLDSDHAHIAWGIGPTVHAHLPHVHPDADRSDSQSFDEPLDRHGESIDLFLFEVEKIASPIALAVEAAEPHVPVWSPLGTTTQSPPVRARGRPPALESPRGPPALFIL